MRCSAARLSSVAWRRAASDSVAVEERSCSAWSVASWACAEAAFSSRSASVRARRRICVGLGAGRPPPRSGAAARASTATRSASARAAASACSASARDSSSEPAGLRLGAGAQLLGPRHVLVDVRLDGLPALGQLLVELLAAGHRLGVQLGLETGGLLGVLLEDALGLRAGLAQLALGVGAQLVGLDLGVAQHLLGLVADVGRRRRRDGT